MERLPERQNTPRSPAAAPPPCWHAPNGSSRRLQPKGPAGSTPTQPPTNRSSPLCPPQPRPCAGRSNSPQPQSAPPQPASPQPAPPQPAAPQPAPLQPGQRLTSMHSERSKPSASSRPTASASSCVSSTSTVPGGRSPSACMQGAGRARTGGHPLQGPRGQGGRVSGWVTLCRSGDKSG